MSINKIEVTAIGDDLHKLLKARDAGVMLMVESVNVGGSSDLVTVNLCDFDTQVSSNDAGENSAIASIKPRRVKVEYVKVLSVFELDKDKMHGGEYGRLDSDGLFYPQTNEVTVVGTLTLDGLYRKVEKEQEWWEDAAKYINESDCICAMANIEDGNLTIEGKPSKEQWVEFAKLILEGCE